MNMIISQFLSFVKIEFDDEIRTLIILVSLSNSWETMRMTVSNSNKKMKLKYDNIWYLILIEEICIIESGDISSSGSTLNIDTWSKGHSKPKFKNNDRTKSSRSGQQITCWRCGKMAISKETIGIQRGLRETLWTWWLRKYNMFYFLQFIIQLMIECWIHALHSIPLHTEKDHVELYCWWFW